MGTSRIHHYNTEQFITRMKKIHKDKYDYSKVNYINAHTKVQIICPEHGEFSILARHHVLGHGCSKCGLRIGFKHSEETKRKQSISLTGKSHPHTQAQKDKNSERFLKLWQDPIFRAKMTVKETRRKWALKSAMTRMVNGTKVNNPRYFNTKPEQEMKRILSELEYDFIHGYPVFNIVHNYVADFFIPKLNTIIEVDGKYWHNYPHGTEKDKIRTQEMIDAGFKVLRFWEYEYDVMKMKTILMDIEARV